MVYTFFQNPKNTTIYFFCFKRFLEQCFQVASMLLIFRLDDKFCTNSGSQ